MSLDIYQYIHLEEGMQTSGIMKIDTKETPIVSIITVVCNGVSSLEKTIKSVINQTYNNIEYIIIDGGSTDGTLGLIKKYEDHIARWISEEDDGLYFAMNKGIELANGEWLIFLNSGDCFFSKDTLTHVGFEKFNGKGLLYGKALVVDRELNMTRVSGGKVKYPDDFTKDTPICHQTIFYSKRIIREFVYNTDYKVLADYEQMIRIFGARIESVYIDQIIVNFERGGFAVENGYRSSFERWKIISGNFNLVHALQFILRLPYWVFAVTIIKLLKDIKLYKYYRMFKFKYFDFFKS